MRSGWCFKTSLRCVFLMVSMSAFLLIPSATYGSGGKGSDILRDRSIETAQRRTDVGEFDRVLWLLIQIWRSTTGHNRHYAQPRQVDAPFPHQLRPQGEQQQQQQQLSTSQHGAFMYTKDGGRW